jgi:hypothetical protein
MSYPFATIEFHDVALRLGIAGVYEVAGTYLMGEADIDSAGRVTEIRLANAAKDRPDIVVERTSPEFRVMARSVEIGCADEISNLTDDDEDTYQSYANEHRQRVHEVL